MPPHAPIGLFGKVPSQGDFLRLNVADPAAQALVAWLQEAIEPVYRARLSLPPAPVRFLFRVPGAESALVGVMAASVDRVGRAFPLCGFAVLPGRALASAYPALAAAARPFLDALEALVLSASGGGEGLQDRARSLSPPDAAQVVAAADVAHAALGAEPVQALVERLFADLPPGAAAYALSTLEAATRSLRGREPARAALALDCPAAQDADRFTWLELVRRALAWPAPPPFFWTEGGAGRVVVSLGAAGPAALVHLCDPARPGAKVWPLRTANPQAIDAARRSVPPAALAVLDHGGTVESLVAAAAR